MSYLMFGIVSILGGGISAFLCLSGLAWNSFLAALVVLAIGIVVLFICSAMLLGSEESSAANYLGAALIVLGELAASAGSLYVLSQICIGFSSILFHDTRSFWYKVAIAVWVIATAVTLWMCFQKYVNKVDFDAEAEEQIARERRAEMRRINAELMRDTAPSFDSDDDYAGDSSGSGLARLPVIVYDSGNRQWTRRGIYGDHAEYYNADGDTVIIYDADVSGNSASTSAGTLHWY